MSQFITETFTRQYKTNVELLLQTMGSQLRGAVMEETYTGEGGRPVNQIGQVVARKREVRHADTPLIETPHSSRWVEPADYEWADLIDDQDKLRTLVDPQGPYAQNGALALGRSIDAEIVAAALGSAKTGPQGAGTAEAFDTTNFSVASGSVGMTVDKLITAKRMLMAAKVDVRRESLYVVMKAKQHANLLNETRASSRDYNDQPILKNGMIDMFMGFKFIFLEEIDAVSSEDACFAWAKSGIHLGIWNDITTRISERADKSYATQVYVKGTFGATRTQQGKIIRILCA